jgi:hypothetical protein
MFIVEGAAHVEKAIVKVMAGRITSAAILVEASMLVRLDFGGLCFEHGEPRGEVSVAGVVTLS